MPSWERRECDALLHFPRHLPFRRIFALQYNKPRPETRLLSPTIIYMSFDSLGLSDALLKAISTKGYTTPTPIQIKAIPVILDKRDILASAQTGTGKTAGFTLPMLQLLGEWKHPGKRPIRALVLTPTRELAAQVQESVEDYGKYMNMDSLVIFGGVNQNPQVSKLRRGVDILVATPGRLLDLESQGALSLSKVEFLVLDEADRMLDMGFARDIKRVMALLPPKRQNLLFSATFSNEIKKLASNILNNPVSVAATPENTTAERVAQRAFHVDKGKKTALLIKLISEGQWSQVLVFTRTKHGANKLSQSLDKTKISSAAIHGNKSQSARTKALSGFKEGNIRVLVATDIAARGLDIPLLPHVVNFELPNVAEDYVHRIGRTGRAGAEGEALSLVCSEELEYLRGIEKLLGEKMKLGVYEGFEPDPNAPVGPPPASQQARRENQASRKPKSNGPSRRPGGQGSGRRPAGGPSSGNRRSKPSGNQR
jgi:ATP-dependent RNA helicase RhlE